MRYAALGAGRKHQGSALSKELARLSNKALSNTRAKGMMAYLNRDPGMCRFEPDPARGRNDLVAGPEAALRLLARRPARAACFRDLSYAKPPPRAGASRTREACDAVERRVRREIAAEAISSPRGRAAARGGGGRAGGTAYCDGRRQDVWGAWDWEGPAPRGERGRRRCRHGRGTTGRARRDKAKDTPSTRPSRTVESVRALGGTSRRRAMSEAASA